MQGMRAHHRWQETLAANKSRTPCHMDLFLKSLRVVTDVIGCPTPVL